MMSNESVEVLYQEHRARHRDHVAWQDELRDWSREHRKAAAGVEALMHSYEAELNHQSDLVEAHELSIETHDAALHGSGANLERLQERHGELAERHKLVGDHQRRLRDRHAALLSAFDALLRS